jgi:hypothetical protein
MFESLILFPRPTETPVTRTRSVGEMGQQLSSERFEAAAAPLLKKAKTPPSFFRPQALSYRNPSINATVHLAFLADGTIAGSVLLFDRASLAVRGIFRIADESRVVTTEVELSCDEASESSNDFGSNRLVVGADGQLASPEAAPTFTVDWISESAFAEQFLPPLQSQAEMDVEAKRRADAANTAKNSSNSTARSGRVGYRERTASDTALAAALSALGVEHAALSLEQPEAFFMQEGEYNTGITPAAGTSATPDAVANSATRARGSLSPARSAAAANRAAPLVATGSPGGKARSESPFSRPRSAATGSRSRVPPQRLFERLNGSYTLPETREELQELFDSWAREFSEGAGFLPRRDFVDAYLEFEAELGLEVSQADLERLFNKVELVSGTRDDKMSFAEFEYFLLQRGRL